MTDFVYKYVAPEDRGMTRIKVSAKAHNAVFKYRQRTLLKSLFFKYEYYQNDWQVEVQQLPTIINKALETVLVPLSLLIHGISNYKEVLKDIKRNWSPKKYGAFSADSATGVHKDKLLEKNNA